MESVYDKLTAELKGYSNNHLSDVWEALRDYDPAEKHTSGITMDEWAEMVYCEVSARREAQWQAWKIEKGLELI